MKLSVSLLTSLLTLAWLAMPSRAAWAHPITFQDSIVFWSTNQPDQSAIQLNWTASRRFAVGLTEQRFNYRSRVAEFVYPQVNFLIHRWNETRAQANIYLEAGGGLLDYADRQSLAGMAALDMDYETREVYFALMAQTLQAKHGPDFSHLMTRAGLAPYLAEFDGLQTWLIGEVDYRPYRASRWMLTPFLRFFYRNVLWEVGSSTRGDWMLNLMVHF